MSVLTLRTNARQSAFCIAALRRSTHPAASRLRNPTAFASPAFIQCRTACCHLSTASSAPPSSFNSSQPSHASRSSADSSAASIRALLQPHFDLEQMEFLATYGSAAFEQISQEEVDARANKTSSSPASPAAPLSSSSSAPSSSSRKNNSSAAAAAAAEEEPMLDLIFAVADPMEFHRVNIERNPSHYSFLRFLPLSLLARVQEYGAGVYYNTLVRVPLPSASAASSPSSSPPPTRLIKYGVISSTRLQSDLLRWDSLYIAGRMHKPMHFLREMERSIAGAAKENCKSALVAALLILDAKHSCEEKKQQLVADAKACITSAVSSSSAAAVQPLQDDSAASLPDPDSDRLLSFTPHHLFLALCSLSYAGDVRLAVGAENPEKVSKIVRGSWGELVELYGPLVREVLGEGVDISSPHTPLSFPFPTSRRIALLAALPPHVQHLMIAGDKELLKINLVRRPVLFELAKPSLTPLWSLVASRSPASRHQLLSRSLARIVSRSSRQQTLKGLLTAGLGKSVRYVWAKIKKSFKK